MCGSKAGIKYYPLPADDPQQRKPDISRAQSLLAWSPEIKLADGLRLTVDDFAKRAPRKVTSVVAD
jgi:UDP-glucuronate decarboxylase